jgi:hypothetical protein
LLAAFDVAEHQGSLQVEVGEIRAGEAVTDDHPLLN